MATPHKHAAAIKAWADGAEIEYQYREKEKGSPEVWCLCSTPPWDLDTKYRIKPQNLVCFVPLYKSPSDTLRTLDGRSTYKDAKHDLDDDDGTEGLVLRVEVCPDALSLISATLVKA